MTTQTEIIQNIDTAKIVADMLKQVNAEYVLDTTYGVGRFYKFFRPKFLVGIDPHIYPNSIYIVKPDILIPKTVWGAFKTLKLLGVKFNICVVDPPFRHRPRGKDNRLYYYNLIGTPEDIIRHSFKIAEELKIPYLLLHFNKPYDGTKIRTIKYIYERGFLKIESYFILYKVIPNVKTP